MCTRDHRFQGVVQQLPDDRIPRGAQRCAGCAYEIGFAAGLERRALVSVDLAAIPICESSPRQQSPHMAWALGYLHGVMRAYATA